MPNPSQILAALLELHELEARLGGTKPRGTSALGRELEALRGRIPAVVLSHHDRMRVRGKRSIAPIRHGVCFGCFIAVPIGDRAHIESGRDLPLCQTCGRFLYVEAVGETGGPERRTAAPGDAQPARSRGSKRGVKPVSTARRRVKALTLEPGRRRRLG